MKALEGVALPDLEQLQRAIETGALKCPIQESALGAANLGQLGPRLGHLKGLEKAAVLAVLRAVIVERQEASRPELTLVWTGPDPIQSTTRDTAIVVRELFAQAKKSVLIAGFCFDHGAVIFEPLYRGMKEREIEATLVLQIPRIEQQGQSEKEHIDTAVQRFLKDNWPFGEPRPAIYYDPRTVPYGSEVSMHAKCIVIDDEKALITSANFTDRGQTRNLEVGVLIEDRGFAGELGAQWRRARAYGGVIGWMG